MKKKRKNMSRVWGKVPCLAGCLVVGKKTLLHGEKSGQETEAGQKKGDRQPPKKPNTSTGP